VAGPLVCSPSPSWLALVTVSLAMLGVVDVVAVVEVYVMTKFVCEPLRLKWLTKVWYALVPKELT
jgi:hypothetical protein